MVTSGFFNSVNGDRKYNAEQMSAIFDGVINDGVFINVGTAFEVKADTGDQVTVGIGRAWINSTWIYNDTILLVQLGESDILSDRIDAVVLETDHSAPVRTGSIKVVEGVAGTEPKRPTLEHSFYVHQYPLAYILRPKNSNAITQSNITYMVGTSELPFVTGILETLDIDALVAQWGAEWKEWFDKIKVETSGDIVEYQKEWDAWFGGVREELTTDVAGNLQAQINRQKTFLRITSVGKVGWYRVAVREIDPNLSTVFVPTEADNITIKIGRNYVNLKPEYHELHLVAAYTDAYFEHITDFANDQSHFIIKKIRLVGVSNKLYIDIWYDYEKANSIFISIEPSTLVQSPAEPWMALNASTMVGDEDYDTLYTEEWLNNQTSPDMTRLSLKRYGNNLEGGVFTGNIDTDLLPGPGGIPNLKCGCYICYSDRTGGTLPYFVQPSGQTLNRFYLIVDPMTNGNVQIAYPAYSSAESSGTLSIRIYGAGENGKWTVWTKLTDFLPLTGGALTGRLTIGKKQALCWIGTYGNEMIIQNYGECHFYYKAADQTDYVNAMAINEAGLTFSIPFYCYGGGFLQGGSNIVFRDANNSATAIAMYMNTNGRMYWKNMNTNTNLMNLDSSGNLTTAASITSTAAGLSLMGGSAIIGAIAYGYPGLTLKSGETMNSKAVTFRIYLGGITGATAVIGWNVAANPIEIQGSQVKFTDLLGAYIPIYAKSFNTQSSSILTKENIEDFSEENARKLLELRPVTFDYKDGFGEKDQLGLIAEEVLDVIPQAVTIPEGYSEEEFDEEKGLENKVLSLDYSKFVPHLIKMVQVQQGEIDEQKRTIQSLEERVSRLESLLESRLAEE